MESYIPVIVWLLSALACAWIAKVRNVRANTLWAIVVAILGPFAIPLVLVARPQKPLESEQHHRAR